MDLNDLPPFLKMSEIVSSRKPARKGLVPFGRSKWLEYRKAGKIPQGRQVGAPNTPVIYTREEVLGVIKMIEAGEMSL
jgi:hypothetical protein